MLKVDGVRSDCRGCRAEEDFEVVWLHVRGEQWGVQLQVNVTPLFCLYCSRQLSHFYYWNGSRYGDAGVADCDRCGATINCVDSDNVIVDYLQTYTSKDGIPVGDLTLDYMQLYHLQNMVWRALKMKTGYDVFGKHLGQVVPLKDALHEICTLVDFVPAPLDVSVTTHLSITRLPTIITNWVQLLRHLEIDL